MLNTSAMRRSNSLRSMRRKCTGSGTFAPGPAGAGPVHVGVRLTRSAARLLGQDMKRPPNCCHTPTFVIAWDEEATDITLDVCSCWPGGADVDGLVVWSEPGNGEAIVRAAQWIIRWAEGRGGRCFGVTERELDQAESNAHSMGVLVVRVTTPW